LAGVNNFYDERTVLQVAPGNVGVARSGLAAGLSTTPRQLRFFA
jgi:hypothetical protein